MEQHTDVQLLFVNDGSKDDTMAVLRDLEACSGSIHALDLQPNGGKAEAVRRGMLYAVQNIQSDYVAFWDADLATPLKEVLSMQLWADEGFDIVMGLRLMRLGARVRRKTMRHYLGRCFATAASLLLDLPVYDTQCGAKLFRASVVDKLFSEPFITKWLFDVELLARYKQLYGKQDAIDKVYEYPLFQWEDVDGSRLRSRDFFKAPLELVKIRRRYKSRRHPHSCGCTSHKTAS